MVTNLLGKNIQLTWFRQFRQLAGRYCSCLLPRQDGGTSQIQVNGRLLPRRCVVRLATNRKQTTFEILLKRLCSLWMIVMSRPGILLQKLGG